MTTDDRVWSALGLAAPARRALLNAGIHDLQALAAQSRTAIAGLHGMGPRALALLDAALTGARLTWTVESR